MGGQRAAAGMGARAPRWAQDATQARRAPLGMPVSTRVKCGSQITDLEERGSDARLSESCDDLRWSAISPVIDQAERRFWPQCRKTVTRISEKAGPLIKRTPSSSGTSGRTALIGRSTAIFRRRTSRQRICPRSDGLVDQSYKETHTASVRLPRPRLRSGAEISTVFRECHKTTDK